MATKEFKNGSYYTFNNVRQMAGNRCVTYAYFTAVNDSDDTVINQFKVIFYCPDRNIIPGEFEITINKNGEPPIIPYQNIPYDSYYNCNNSSLESVPESLWGDFEFDRITPNSTYSIQMYYNNVFGQGSNVVGGDITLECMASSYNSALPIGESGRLTIQYDSGQVLLFEKQLTYSELCDLLKYGIYIDIPTYSHNLEYDGFDCSIYFTAENNSTANNGVIGKNFMLETYLDETVNTFTLLGPGYKTSDNSYRRNVRDYANYILYFINGTNYNDKTYKTDFKKYEISGHVDLYIDDSFVETVAEFSGEYDEKNLSTNLCDFSEVSGMRDNYYSYFKLVLDTFNEIES